MSNIEAGHVCVRSSRGTLMGGAGGEISGYDVEVSGKVVLLTNFGFMPFHQVLDHFLSKNEVEILHLSHSESVGNVVVGNSREYNKSILLIIK